MIDRVTGKFFKEQKIFPRSHIYGKPKPWFTMRYYAIPGRVRPVDWVYNFELAKSQKEDQAQEDGKK